MSDDTWRLGEHYSIQERDANWVQVSPEDFQRLVTSDAEVERLKASITFKDDAMLTAMRNLVANDATFKQLTQERDEALAAVERVKALHQMTNSLLRCTHDDYWWPCPTIQALELPTSPGPDLDVAPDAPTEVRGQAWGQAGQP